MGREGEKHPYARDTSSGCPHTPPTGDSAPTSGICPDQELNQQPFGLQVGT